MSTSPRVRARPSIDAPSTGSTMPGNSVTTSIRIEALQVEQPLGRPDDHAARREVDLAHDLGNRWDQMLPRVVAHDPEVLRRRPLDAGHPPDPRRIVRHRRHADLSGEPVGPGDRADHDEAIAHSALTFARSRRTVVDGWAPLAIHA